MIYKDFDDFLMSVFTEETNLLDDDIPDGFEDWIVEQDKEEIMRLADIYGMEKNREGFAEAVKIWEKTLSNLREEIDNATSN